MLTFRLAGALIVLPVLSGCMTQSTSPDELKSILRAQVERCYRLPDAVENDRSITLEFRLKANGTLAQAPVVVAGDANSSFAKAAIRSLDECSPFAIPASVAARLPDGLPMRIEFSRR